MLRLIGDLKRMERMESRQYHRGDHDHDLRKLSSLQEERASSLTPAPPDAADFDADRPPAGEADNEGTEGEISRGVEEGASGNQQAGIGRFTAADLAEEDKIILTSSMRVIAGNDDGRTGGSSGGNRSWRGRMGKKDAKSALYKTGDSVEVSSDEQAYLLGQRKQQKKVNAQPEVLQTYHESSLYGRVPLTTKLQAALRSGFIGYFIYLLGFIGALLSGVFYIWATYTVDTPNWISQGQNVISVFFTADYFVRVYSEPVRIYYMTSAGGIIDAIAIIPIITLFITSNGGGTDVLHLLQFLRVLRIYPLLNKIGIRGTNLHQQLFLLLVSIFGIVLIDAGLVQYVEFQWFRAHTAELDCPPTGCMTFFQAVYFIWVTVSTVGYGDITPKSDYGRAVAMGTILLALVILPVQIQNLSTIAARRPYGGTFSVSKVAGSRYAIVSGSISYATVEHFLADFYRSTHDSDLTAYIDSTYPLKTIVLAPFRPSHQLTTLIAKYNGVVEFIEGSPIKSRDLDRVHARAASCVFLLADSGTDDIPAEDHNQIIRALSVQRYCGANSRIIVEVLRPETQASAVWDSTRGPNMQVVCLDKIRFRLLARGCFAKGLCTFISNLFMPEVDLRGFDSEHFMTEYQIGFRNEVYPILFPHLFIGYKFEEVADFLFSQRGVLLFGLDVITESGRDVFLFPRGRILDPSDVGLLFARGIEDVFKISGMKTSSGSCVCSFGWRCPCLEKRSRRNLEKKFFQTPMAELQDAWEHYCSEMKDYSVLENSLSFSEVPLSSGSSQRIAPFMDPTNLVEGEDDEQHDGGEANGDAEPSAASKSTRRETLTLESAVGRLLSWPPLGISGRPYPAALLKSADKILANLIERTLDIVHLDVPHILVCAQGQWHNNLFYFLGSLRHMAGPPVPVVVLHPHEPMPVQWGHAGLFARVYFVRGSPLYEVDLLRAGVQRAAKVVVLADFGKPPDQFTDEVEETPSAARQSSAYSSDVQNIVIAANVERLRPKDGLGVLTVEFQHPSNMRYLPPHFPLNKSRVSRPDWSRCRDGLLNFCPPYMEGKAHSPFQLGFILRATFYNSNTLRIVELLMEGRIRQTAPPSPILTPGPVQQIEVPAEYVNRPFQDLFRGMLMDKGTLPLGLYRSQGTLGSPTPYVYTNPAGGAIVQKDDLLFVLR